MVPAVGPDGNVYPPVITDFTYDNIGVPRNHSIPGGPQPDIGLTAKEEAAVVVAFMKTLADGYDVESSWMY